MTSHLDSHTTTDVQPEMLSGVQTGKGIPHVRYDIRGTAHAHTIRKNGDNLNNGNDLNNEDDQKKEDNLEDILKNKKYTKNEHSLTSIT